MKQRRESMSSKRLDLVQCNETQPLLHLLPWVHQKRNPIGRDQEGKRSSLTSPPHLALRRLWYSTREAVMLYALARSKSCMCCAGAV